MRENIEKLLNKTTLSEKEKSELLESLLSLYTHNSDYVEEVAEERFPSFPEDGQGGTCWDTCANDKQDAFMQGVDWVIEYNVPRIRCV